MSNEIKLTEWGRKGKMRYVKESEKKIKKDKKVVQARVRKQKELVEIFRNKKKLKKFMSIKERT